MKTAFRLIFLLLMLLSACKSPRISREVKNFTIGQFMSNNEMFGGGFSADEKNILVNSNKSGIFNAYILPVEGGDLVPLTRSDSTSIYAVSFFPKDDRILFLSDNNGDEVYHIYVLYTDSMVTDLTPWLNARSTFYQWNFDEESFVFGSNKRNERFMDIYEMNIKSLTSKMIYQNDAGYDFGGISSNKQFIVFVKSITSGNDEMYIYNMRNKKLSHISKHTGNSNYSPTGFSSDSRTLFYTTNEGSEFTYLVRFDINSGTRETLLKYPWDIWYSNLSYNEKYRVTGINEDARTVVKVTNNVANEEISFPDNILGDIKDVTISKSEKRMTFWVGTSKSPNDLYIYDFSTGTATLLQTALNPQIDRDELVEGEVVRFSSFDGLEIPAILYLPHQVSEEKPGPALVWVHGGPGDQSRLSYSPLLQYLVNKGYVIIAVNNRGSSGYGKTFYQLDNRNHGENDLMDCISAKKYLAETGYVDTNKIGIIGGSYGGFMVMAALTMHPKAFATGVNLFGVTNWIRTLKNIPPWWESFRAALYDEMGDPQTDSIRLWRISPLFHADKIEKPFMVLQGANDPRVIQAESDEIVAAARKNHVEVEYVLFSDEGHGFDKKENQIVANEKILVFLDKHLKGTKKQQKKEGE
jgi:dipeptidyl aminopeptidase/acylaminoacyl peptidase